MSGKLISKAQRQLSRSVDSTFFWSQNGPQLSGLLDDASSPTRLGLSLQMLATSSSDEPKSQFVSVALDYEVASGFGEPVYKFQLNPRSPVLGLRGCRMGGEAQFQVPGSTPIRNLHRRVRTNGYWERYVTDKQTWERIP